MFQAVHGLVIPERARPEHGAGDPTDQPRERGADAQVAGHQRPDALRLHGRPTGGDLVTGAGAALRPRRAERPRRAHETWPPDGRVPVGPDAEQDVGGE